MDKNLISKLKSISLNSAVSRKTNNPYTYVNIVFDNDFRLRVFLNDEQLFILNSFAPSTSAIPVKDGSLDDVDMGAFLEN